MTDRDLYKQTPGYQIRRNEVFLTMIGIRELVECHSNDLVYKRLVTKKGIKALVAILEALAQNPDAFLERRGMVDVYLNEKGAKVE